MQHSTSVLRSHPLKPSTINVITACVAACADCAEACRACEKACAALLDVMP